MATAAPSTPAPSGPPVVNGKQTSGVDPHPDAAGYSPAQAESRIEDILRKRSGQAGVDAVDRAEDGRFQSRRARQAAQRAQEAAADAPEGSEGLDDAPRAARGRQRAEEALDEQDDGPADEVYGGPLDDEDDDTPVSTDASGSVEDDEDDEDTEDVDFEHNGRTYKVPKPLVDGAMRQADYTKAKQETKAERAAVAAERKAMSVNMRIAQELAPVVAQVQNVEQTIRELEGKMPDPSVDLMGYVTLDKQIRGLRAGLEQLKAAAAERGTELRAEEQSAQAELRRAALDYIGKVIPKWADANYRAATAEYALKLGYSKDELEAVTDPRLIQLLSDSMHYQRIKSSQPAIRKKVANAPPVVRPTGTQSQASQQRSSVDALKTRAKRSGSMHDAEAAMLAVLQQAKRGRRARG